MDATMVKQLRRVRTLGRGASGAVVWLASDDDSGKLLAVKSAVAGGAALLRREGRVLSGLCSPHIVPCLGCRAAAGGEYQLFLEFAPGGSLADEAARSGGRLPEHAIRAYVGDVARGLAYLHARSLVHGDVKARNVVIGGDGRARLTDFGCARTLDSVRPIGGTPAFMAPEVARGEEQGPAADVWALGCTVIEMATGRAPWSDMDDILAAVHRIGYTDSVPEVPGWLSAEAKDFLDGCFRRHPSNRSAVAQLLDHPFVASAAVRDCKTEQAKQEWASPKSTLHDAFWDSDTDDEADEMSTSPADRIGALACATSALPDWDSDEGWIDVHNESSEAPDAPPANEAADADYFVWAEEPDAEFEQLVVPADGSNDLPRNAGVIDASIWQNSYLYHVYLDSGRNKIPHPSDSDGNGTVKLNRICNTNGVIKSIFAQISTLLRPTSRYTSCAYALRCKSINQSCDSSRPNWIMLSRNDVEVISCFQPIRTEFVREQQIILLIYPSCLHVRNTGRGLIAYSRVIIRCIIMTSLLSISLIKRREWASLDQRDVNSSMPLTEIRSNDIFAFAFAFLTPLG